MSSPPSHRVIARGPAQQMGKMPQPLRDALADALSEFISVRFRAELAAFFAAVDARLAALPAAAPAALILHGGAALHELLSPAQRARLEGLRARADASLAPLLERLLAPVRDIDLSLVHRVAPACGTADVACARAAPAIEATRACMAALAREMGASIRRQGVVPFHQEARAFVNARAAAAGSALGALGVRGLPFLTMRRAHNTTIRGEGDGKETVVVEHVRPSAQPGMLSVDQINCDARSFEPGLPAEGVPEDAPACHSVRATFNTTIRVTWAKSAHGPKIDRVSHLLRLTLMWFCKAQLADGRAQSVVVPANFLDVAVPQRGDGLYGGRAALTPAEFEALTAHRATTPAFRGLRVPTLAEMTYDSAMGFVDSVHKAAAAAAAADEHAALAVAGRAQADKFRNRALALVGLMGAGSGAGGTAAWAARTAERVIDAVPQLGPLGRGAARKRLRDTYVEVLAAMLASGSAADVVRALAALAAGGSGPRAPQRGVNAASRSASGAPRISGHRESVGHMARHGARVRDGRADRLGAAAAATGGRQLP